MSASRVGSVTDNTSPQRASSVTRNAPRVEHGAYVAPAGLALDWNGGWVSCSECGGKSHWRHCVTCHQQAEYGVSKYDGSSYPQSPDHGSFFGCGRCLPPGSHRRYCSITCRVRTHNYYRHTIAGRARVVQQTLDNAAWREAHKGMFGRVSPRRVAERKAKHYGNVCGSCGTELAAEDPVWLLRSAPVCRACVAPDASEPGGGSRWLGPLPCDGCGRPVYFGGNMQRHRRVDGSWVRWAVCSQRCYQQVKYLEMKLRKAAEREPIDCAVCGERVNARRADARYCSDACRMVAYRARKVAQS